MNKSHEQVQQKSVELPAVDNDKPSEAINVNVVKALEQLDYQYARALCDDNSNWEIEFEGKKTKVWSRRLPDSPLQMFKSKSEFKDVPADVCYDVLQDLDYRYKWDKYLMTTTRIGYLDQNNDVCYYTVGSLPPFRSRDFVLFRSWLDMDKEKFILAHSVWHDKFPPNKDFIRGTVYLTINFVKTLEKGCQFTYLTLVDPKGKLPNWLINRVTKTIAPRLCKKLRKACLGYDRWKRKHKRTDDNNFWRIGEIKSNIPKLEMADCVYKGGDVTEDWPDESGIQPNAVDDEEEKEEEEDDEDGEKM